MRSIRDRKHEHKHINYKKRYRYIILLILTMIVFSMTEIVVTGLVFSMDESILNSEINIYGNQSFKVEIGGMLKMDQELFVLKDCSKSYITKYYRVDALKTTNLTVPKGINIIHGKSGSGKSTFMHVLASMEKPTSGSVYYKKKSIYTEHDIQLLRRREFGFVFQSYNLIEDFNVYDNITLPLVFDKSDDFTVFDEAVEILNLKNKLKRYPSTLSGGEKQRVAIARAIVNHPKVIFADEPTGNLDEENSMLVVEMLIDLCKKFNASLLMVTHDNDYIRYGEAVFMIHNGVITRES